MGVAQAPPGSRVDRGRAGLLAAAQVDLVADPPFADRHALGHAARGDQHLRLEPFEGADLGVVADQDAGRPEPIAEHGDDLRLQPLGRLRQRLHHEIVAVAIDDQRRQQVALAVDQPIGGGVDGQRLTEADRLIESSAEEIGTDDGAAGGEEPQRNLGTVAVESRPERPAARPQDLDDVAGRRRHLAEVGPINPNVSRLCALYAARRDDH